MNNCKVKTLVPGGAYAVRTHTQSTSQHAGIGIYCGPGKRGNRVDKIARFIWDGRLVTFDAEYWAFTRVTDRE